MRNLFNLHVGCESRESALLRERDRLETELMKANKRYDDLLAAYGSLSTATVQSYQPHFSMDHLFQEVERPDDKQEFLTPTWTDREGETP